MWRRLICVPNNIGHSGCWNRWPTRRRGEPGSLALPGSLRAEELFVHSHEGIGCNLYSVLQVALSNKPLKKASQLSVDVQRAGAARLF
jgi:hypothetical protein